MIGDDTRAMWQDSLFVNKADKAFMLHAARTKIDDPIKRRQTIAWILAKKRTLRDVRALAKRWGLVIPSDEYHP